MFAVRKVVNGLFCCLGLEGACLNLTLSFLAGNFTRLQTHHPVPHDACHLHGHVNVENSPGKRSVRLTSKSSPSHISTESSGVWGTFSRTVFAAASLREGPGTAHMEMPVVCPMPLPHGVQNMLSIDRRHSPSELTCYSTRSTAASRWAYSLKPRHFTWRMFSRK